MPAPSFDNPPSTKPPRANKSSSQANNKPNHANKPHHKKLKKYSDMWWRDMPEKAQKAAAVLGYTEETWDTDAVISFDDHSFFQCTPLEKRAAMFLGMSPMDKKGEMYWTMLDKPTKDAAQALAALGWTKLPKSDDEWLWDNMTKEKKNAAHHLGYTKTTWEEEFNKKKKMQRKKQQQATTQQPTEEPTESTEPTKTTGPTSLTTEEQRKVDDITETDEDENDSKFVDSFLNNMCCAPRCNFLPVVTE